MSNDLIEIFIGSEIEANYISALLAENSIDNISENILNQSISAGWAAGSFYNSNIIRIDIKDLNRAKQILDEYFKDRN